MALNPVLHLLVTGPGSGQVNNRSVFFAFMGESGGIRAFSAFNTAKNKYHHKLLFRTDSSVSMSSAERVPIRIKPSSPKEAQSRT